MKILITGGTGFIGSELIKHLITHKVVLLTRSPDKARQALQFADNGNIQYLSSLDQLHDLNHFDAVINLAGEPIAGKRWTKRQKNTICDSRWKITEKLVDLFHASTEPPTTFISGSAVGIYGDQQAHPFDESLNTFHEGFTHETCSVWESIAKKAEHEDTRVCLLRTGIVLGHKGALKMMLPAFKLGLGSMLGNGKQYMPWIHIQDMVKGIIYLLETPHARGEFNFCAPHPVSNYEFSKTLGKVIKRPVFMYTPKWFFKLLMGEASCLLFDSIRAKPKHLTELGFNFTYPRLEPALRNIMEHD